MEDLPFCIIDFSSRDPSSFGCLTIPKREVEDGPGFDAEFCLLAELAGLELLAEIPVVLPTDLGALKTMVCQAIEVLSILSCTGITVFCLSQLE